MNHLLCWVNPVGCVATSVAKSTLGDLFSALTNWVLTSVEWLLNAVSTQLVSALKRSPKVDLATEVATQPTGLTQQSRWFIS